MLAFTFPGQGSQRPGMGRPWADHESWELVDEASEVAERDVAHLLLDADADELQRHPQRPAHHVRVQPDGARRRRAPRHRAERSAPGTASASTRRSTATGALGFDDGVRLVAERAEAMHEAGIDNPGTMAAVLGLDDDQVEVACRRADGDVWVANFNAPGQVVIAGSPEGVAAAGAVAKELGAKKVMPLQVSRRVPHAVHGAGPRPAAQGARRGRAPRHRGPGRLQRRRRSPTTTAHDWAEPAVGAAVQPGALEALPARRSRTHGVTDFVELGPGGVLTGMAKRTRRRTPARSRSPTPDDLDKLLEWHRRRQPPTRSGAARGRAPVRRRAARRQPGGRALHPDRRARRRQRDRRSATVLGHVGDTEVRSPFAGVLQSYIAVDGERVTLRQPIAWLRTS